MLTLRHDAKLGKAVCDVLVTLEKLRINIQIRHYSNLAFITCSIELIQYIHIIGNQNTTKYLLHCMYNMLYNYMFRPFFSRSSSGCIYLALRVLYHGDKIRLIW